jgi:hypothetical protein
MMEDIKKIQEFFSKPLEEINETKFSKPTGLPYEQKDLYAQELFGIEYFNWLDFWEQFHIVQKYKLDKSIITKESKEVNLKTSKEVQESTYNEYSEVGYKKVGEEMMSLDDQAKAYFLEKFKKGEIDSLPDNPKAAFLDQMMKDEMEKDAAQFRSERGLEETNLSEAFVPSNIKEFAKRKGVSSLVNTVAGWAERVGRRITGGTAIGKNYDTLILDMRYQDSAIRINTENETVELYDEPVRSFQQFKKVYEEYQEEESIEEINDPRIGNSKFGSAPQQFADLRAKLGDEALLDKIQMIDVNSLRNILDELDSYNLQEANTLSNYSDYSNDALSDMIVNLSRYEGTEDLVKRVKDELENRRKKAKGEMKEGMGGQLDEKYFIEVSVRDARKALNIYDDMFDGAGIEMYGSNVYASNDFGDLYDLYMSFMSSNIEIIDSTDFDQEPDDEDFEEIDEVTKGFGERFPKDKLKDFIGKTINYYGSRYKVKDVDEAGTLTLVDIEDGEEKSVNYNMFLQKGLIPELKKKFQEAIKLSEGVIEEELCPKGKAYIKRRKAAGEKSSAYLSGRAVKVCKGLMSGTSKKK